MSKKVAIMEGDKSRRFNKVDYLSTRKQGGGHVDWVPEDDRETTTKSITKNGTYKISDEKKTGGGKYYGYSEVTVNVPNSGKAVGKEQDGNTHVVEPDANGDLTDKIIPDKIKITTLPTKLSYTDGESIDFTGGVVKAYQGDGSLWEASGYSGGIIPNSELNFSPNKAYYNGGDGTISSDLDTSPVTQPIPYSLVGQAITNIYENQFHQRVQAIYTFEGMPVIMYRYVGSNTFHYLLATGVQGQSYTNNYTVKVVDTGEIIQSETNYHTVGTLSYTYAGKTVYYVAGSTSVGRTIVVESVTPEVNANFMGSDNLGKIAWTLVYGDSDLGVDDITVSWNRPDDLKELADTYGINVFPLR